MVMTTSLTSDCVLQTHSALPVLTIRSHTPVGELPHVMGKAYGALAQYLGQLGEQPAGPPFVAYYNQDMQDLVIEIGFPLAKAAVGKNEIKAGEIPAGQWATCTYTGPYAGIRSAYDALAEWIASHTLTPTGVAYEMYLNDPAQTRPEELRTQVAIPVQG
jgi:effector-binding domain-containing protein